MPVVAVGVFMLVIGAILTSAGSTLGYDMYAYLHAAQRLLAGQPLYDRTVDVAGAFAIYLYPPPFALLAIPLVPLTAAFGPWPWIALLAGCFVAGVAILPVRRDIRWLILLLGGLSWPLAYSLKLGQVGPMLFLLFAIGWRWRDRPGPLGAAMALGTIVKVQPVLLFGWALLTRRWRAVAVGLAVLAGSALVATVVAGVGTWADYVALLGRVSSSVTTPHNFTPGAIAYQLGVPESAARAIQWISTLAALAIAGWAALRADGEVGYLTAVTATQLVSPLLWDHYAMLLLLPTAWLLERRRRWAVVIPLSTSILVIWLPPVVYPVSFWVALLAPIIMSRRSV
jgi:alpha-1,2-mannosyltransferase